MRRRLAALLVPLLLAGVVGAFVSGCSRPASVPAATVRPHARADSAGHGASASAPGPSAGTGNTSPSSPAHATTRSRSKADPGRTAARAATPAGPGTALAAQPASAPWVPEAWLPSHLLVAYYGNPFSARMGVLGQGSTAAMLQRLRRQSAAYQALTLRTVQPALDLVAVVAQGSPQPDGTFRLRMPATLIAGEVALARRNHMPIFLDVQVGRSTVAQEVYKLAPYLRLPWVDLALDPEFDMPPGQIPGREIGTMSASSINWALDYLSALVARDRLPDKVLIVHQFTGGMVPDWRNIRPRPGVQLVIDMDGFGGTAIKRHNYELFVRQQPIPGRFGGIKLFYAQDHPLLTPLQVLALQPTPSVVLYQ